MWTKFSICKFHCWLWFEMLKKLDWITKIDQNEHGNYFFNLLIFSLLDNSLFQKFHWINWCKISQIAVDNWKLDHSNFSFLSIDLFWTKKITFENKSAFRYLEGEIVLVAYLLVQFSVGLHKLSTITPNSNPIQIHHLQLKIHFFLSKSEFL